MSYEEDNVYRELIDRKCTLENNMSQPDYTSNVSINGVITFHEIDKVISRLKAKKAVGLDLIPNEVLKFPDVKNALLSFFNKCFSLSIVPSIWLKAIIVPVPKSSTKDPCIPLNYRGISLLSCIYKVYSGILNNRINNYFEDRNWYAEEQNGFRRGRSCQDHIFSLTSIIRNRLADNKPTFAAFVDMQKAFDWVDCLFD